MLKALLRILLRILLCLLCVKTELLSHNTCLPLNLLLAKYNFVPEELAAWLIQGNIDSVGADTLKLLIGFLPSDYEVHIAFHCYFQH